MNYKGYIIKELKAYGYYEIITSDGKWFKNAVSIADAKEKIDLAEKNQTLNR